MILDVLVCSLGALLLCLLWKLTAQATQEPYSLADWDAAKVRLNVETFRLLVDREEELYLRRSLGRHCVLPVLRRRAAVARQYVEEIERNAWMLLRMASAAQLSADPEIARTAKQLVRLTLEVRLNVVLAIWCLRLKWLFPTWTLSFPTRLAAYERLIDRGTWLMKCSDAVAPKPIGP